MRATVQKFFPQNHTHTFFPDTFSQWFYRNGKHKKKTQKKRKTVFLLVKREENYCEKPSSSQSEVPVVSIDVCCNIT